MMELLKTEYSEASIESSYQTCCEEPGSLKLSPELERITKAIDDLAGMVSDDLVASCKGMEEGFKAKCDEIKR